MSNKHTPGPWHLQRHDTGDFEVVANTTAGQAELATVHCEAEYVPRLPTEANARLMAAAPELLEAAETMMLIFAGGEPDPDWDKGLLIMWYKAAAVIAHATGGE